MRTLATTRATLTTLLCATALLAQDASWAAAQVEPAVGSGSRVRLTSPSLRLSAAIGTVQEATDGSLLVQFDNPRRSVRVERDGITEMDVSVGRRRQVLKGLGMGTLAGAGAGVVLGLVSGDDPPNVILSFSAEEKAVFLGAFLGATGAVVGLIAGALNYQEAWSPASAGSPPPVDVSVIPFINERGTGLRVGVSLTVH